MAVEVLPIVASGQSGSQSHGAPLVGGYSRKKTAGSKCQGVVTLGAREVVFVC